MPFVIALMIAAVLGGGASIAANNAVPGDALYGVKVNVNEQMRGAFAFSDESKADADIDAIEARLDEAEKLSANTKLDASAEAQIDANLSAHAQSVQDRIERLQADGKWSDAAEVAAKFQATVARHASVLADASVRADTNAQAALAPVISQVQATLNAASNLSINASAQAAAHGEATTTDNRGGSVNSGSGSNSGQGSVNSGSNASSSINSGVKVEDRTHVEVENENETHGGNSGSSSQGKGSVNVGL